MLGGIISPIEGIGPNDLNIESLVKRVKDAEGEIKEVILGLLLSETLLLTGKYGRRNRNSLFP